MLWCVCLLPCCLSCCYQELEAVVERAAVQASSLEEQTRQTPAPAAPQKQAAANTSYTGVSRSAKGSLALDKDVFWFAAQSKDRFRWNMLNSLPLLRQVRKTGARSAHEIKQSGAWAAAAGQTPGIVQRIAATVQGLLQVPQTWRGSRCIHVACIMHCINCNIQCMTRCIHVSTAEADSQTNSTPRCRGEWRRHGLLASHTLFLLDLRRCALTHHACIIHPAIHRTSVC